MVGDVLSIDRARCLLTVGACAVGVMVATRHAGASETFPPILAEKLGMPCVPNCLPCHSAAVGTAANQRFDGVKGEIERLASNDVSAERTLRAALNILLTDETLNLDSDGDGKQDLAELSAGDNPYGGESLCERPRYGCSALHVAPAPPAPFTAFAFALSVAGALWWRRRR